MTRPPQVSIVLTAAGTLPFIFGALMILIAPVNMGDPANGGYPLIVPRDGIEILHSYGIVILCFMSGVLWGFAAKDQTGSRIWPYILSVVPSLYVWSYVPLRPSGPDDPLLFLIFGFLGILAFDYLYQRTKLAPAWWMTLRVPVTVIVVVCLCVGRFTS